MPQVKGGLCFQKVSNSDHGCHLESCGEVDKLHQSETCRKGKDLCKQAVVVHVMQSLQCSLSKARGW
jgi:hypothetical protein